MPLHADQIQLSRNVGANLRSAAEHSFLTNANVAAADTVAGVRSAITAASAHADQVPSKARYDRAIDAGAATSELTDAAILGLTTVDGLVNLTEADNDVNRSQFLS